MTLEGLKATADKLLPAAWQKALAIVAAAAVLGVVYSAVFGGGGEFRACILSLQGGAFGEGNLPSCADGDGGDGTLKKTMVNGRNIGYCRNVSAEGRCLK